MADRKLGGDRMTSEEDRRTWSELKGQGALREDLRDTGQSKGRTGENRDIRRGEDRRTWRDRVGLEGHRTK